MTKLNEYRPEDVTRWNRMLFDRGKVPKKYSGAVYKNLNPAIKKELSPYLNRITYYMKKSQGILFWGGPHTGKATGMVVVLKAAVRLNYTVLYVDAEDARRAAFGFDKFDDDTTIWQRMQQVDFLGIPHLGQEKADDDAFAASLASLVRTRAGARKITLLTSYLSPKELSERYGMSLGAALHDACINIQVKK